MRVFIIYMKYSALLRISFAFEKNSFLVYENELNGLSYVYVLKKIIRPFLLRVSIYYHNIFVDIQ